MRSPEDSRAEESLQARRYLIAAGTAHYENLPDDAQLLSVEEDLRRLVDLFKKLGYQRVLPDLGQNPTDDQLRKNRSA